MSATGADLDTLNARGDARPWGDALWLAGQEIRRAWLSYIVSALYLGFFSGLMTVSDVYVIGTFSFEIGMLFVLILATPFFARDYMSWSKTPITERLSWWRALPIGVPTIVRARMLAIVAALPLNAIAFFVPAWFAGTWDVPRSTFPWFCLAIIGIAIGTAGWTLACEVSLSNRRWILLNCFLILLYFVAVFSLGIAFDVFMFQELAHALSVQGPLVSVAFVVAGVGVMAACMRWAGARLRQRELGA